MSERVIRIGGASGFWGDSELAVPQLLQGGEVDYLAFDYLAELTMSILSRARAKNPLAGYAADFVNVAMRGSIKEIAARGIKVLSNAGGVNPSACAHALRALAASEGLNLKIAVVEGDDLMPSLDSIRQRGVRDLQSGASLPPGLMSANAYLGALPIAEGLRQGAQIVITGRCVDSALPLAALIHEFGWTPRDYDRLAAGSLAGHLIECGPQATGGLHTDWEAVSGWENIGYPIVECHADGRFVVTKPANSGGLVTPAVVAEQMLYEIGDPGAYLLPDVSCDFTQVSLRPDGPDRVLVENVRGSPPSAHYKVSATYGDGWRCVANITLIGGKAEEKAAKIRDAILARTRARFLARGIRDYRRVHTEILGTESAYGPHSRIATSREVILRLVVEHDSPEALEIFAREIAPGGTSWAPGMVNMGGGRPKPTPIVRLFSFLWPKDAVDCTVTVDEVPVRVDIPVVFPQREISQAIVDDGGRGDAPSRGREIDVPLLKIAHGRSGDKGNTVNIGIIARDQRWVALLERQLSAECVKEYFAHLVKGPVTRYSVPGINGFNFVLQDALDGGGMASPRSDPLGKGFAQMLLDLPVRIPADQAPHDDSNRS
jgi:hypothetical protein